MLLITLLQIKTYVSFGVDKHFDADPYAIEFSGIRIGRRAQRSVVPGAGIEPARPVKASGF